MCFSYEKYKNKYQEVSVRASEGSVVKTLLLSPADLSPVSGLHTGRRELTSPSGVITSSGSDRLSASSSSDIPEPKSLGRFVQLCSPQMCSRSSRNGTSPWGSLSFRKMGYSTQHARYWVCQRKTPALPLVNDSSISTSKYLLSI